MIKLWIILDGIGSSDTRHHRDRVHISRRMKGEIVLKILFFDIDTLRADHMGCYGYDRNTSPIMDSVAKEGVCFDNYYCPNAPCLPSRASLVSGQYGIHNGIVGHGGTTADMRLQGDTRRFTDSISDNGLFMQFRKGGFNTVSFSTFAERHSAWWFNSGFNECYNVGGHGEESAEEITPLVLDWLERHKEKDNWMLHIHYWDPHTPYRTPADRKNRFDKEKLSDNWITEDIFKEHLLHIGPHSANEVAMWNDSVNPKYPKQPGKLRNLDEVKQLIDLYDDGVKYTDENIGMVLDYLKKNNLYGDDLAIIITADHGEDLGEFGVYAEHGMADEPVCRIPLIIKWPGMEGGRHVQGFYDNVDLLPTITELLGTEIAENYQFDGRSFAPALLRGEDCSKPYAVLTQCAHVCQRSVRFENYIYIRTLHGGYHLLPDEMLFDLEEDPHEQNNLAKARPELCNKGARMILNWVDEMMKTSAFDVDPLWTVIREGGPYHCKGRLKQYEERLAGTSREFGITELEEKYKGFD